MTRLMAVTALALGALAAQVQAGGIAGTGGPNAVVPNGVKYNGIKHNGDWAAGALMPTSASTAPAGGDIDALRVVRVELPGGRCSRGTAPTIASGVSVAEADQPKKISSASVTRSS